jgi:hypothetical protein
VGHNVQDERPLPVPGLSGGSQGATECSEGQQVSVALARAVMASYQNALHGCHFTIFLYVKLDSTIMPYSLKFCHTKLLTVY